MLKTVNYDVEARNFQEIPNGVRWEAVIFSSEFNRNKYFFDIHKMKRWANKLEKVLLNNNHDGKYFANSTDKITSIEVTTSEDGVTECLAVIESTNEEKRNNPDMVTGFSIELRVDEKNTIKNENGEYYSDYEWQGMAYLIGKLAGSGDTRILNTVTFADQNNIMSEEQIKALLEAQKTELQAEFEAKAESLKTFASEMLAQSSSKSMGSYSWIGEDGKTYTETWENMYKSMTSVDQPDQEPGFFASIADKFGYKKFEGEVKPADPVPPTTDPEITEIEKQLAAKAAHEAKMKTLSLEESVTEPQPTVNPTVAAKTFLSKFKLS